MVRGSRTSEETRKKLSLAHKKLWLDPVYRSRVVAGLKGKQTYFSRVVHPGVSLNSGRTHFRREDKVGSVNDMWKGNSASYSAFHKRLYTRFGKPSVCKRCGTADASKTYDWANLTGNYEDLSDYERMCRSCHRKYDYAKKSGPRHHAGRSEVVTMLGRKKKEEAKNALAKQIAANKQAANGGKRTVMTVKPVVKTAPLKKGASKAIKPAVKPANVVKKAVKTAKKPVKK